MKERELEHLYHEGVKWDGKYFETVYHAVELYEDPKQLKKAIGRFLSRKNRGEFKLTNPYSKQIWLRQLIPSMLKYPENSELEGYRTWEEALQQGGIAVCFVTITHDEWACCDENIQFDLQRAKQKVRNAFIGLSFIATFEAAYYVNENWTTDGVEGNLISFHCHAIVWATHKSQLMRHRGRIKRRFRPILGNKSGIRFDTIKTEEGLCKSVRYQAKMPFYGKRTVREGTKKKQKDAKLSYIQHYRLFKALQKYDLLDVWVAGGDGSVVLRDAKSRLAQYRKEWRSRPIGASHPGIFGVGNGGSYLRV